MAAFVAERDSIWRLELEPVVSAGEAARRNVYLLTGALPTLIDPGPAQAAGQVLDALAALGLGARDISRILLTSPEPDAAGAVTAFTHAVIRSGAAGLAAPDPLVASHRGLVARLARELVEAGLSGLAVELDRDTRLATAGPAVTAQPLGDGELLLAGDLRLVAQPARGIAHAGILFGTVDGAWLWPGELGVIGDDLPVADFAAYTNTLASMTAGPVPERLFPARRSPELDGKTAFRGLALRSSNLVSNLPFVVEKPRSLRDIYLSDTGYWPDDAVKAAWTLTRLHLALSELTRAGVIHASARDGSLLHRVYGLVPDVAPGPRSGSTLTTRQTG